MGCPEQEQAAACDLNKSRQLPASCMEVSLFQHAQYSVSPALQVHMTGGALGILWYALAASPEFVTELYGEALWLCLIVHWPLCMHAPLPLEHERRANGHCWPRDMPEGRFPCVRRMASQHADSTPLRRGGPGDTAGFDMCLSVGFHAPDQARPPTAASATTARSSAPSPTCWRRIASGCCSSSAGPWATWSPSSTSSRSAACCASRPRRRRCVKIHMLSKLPVPDMHMSSGTCVQVCCHACSFA